MANVQKPETSVHGQDFRVWEEILYLDSPSDYREFLPKNSDRANMRDVDLVMLDRRSSSGSRSRATNWPLVIIGLVVLVSSGYLMYALLDAL